jgi:hypothetical protein
MFAASKSGLAAPTSDRFFPYVPLLLKTTTTNGQQNNTFLDSSANNFTITRNGTPAQGSVTPYWPNGQWSNYFNGSSDFLTVPSNAIFSFGTSDFTLECWVFTANPANTNGKTIVDSRPDSTNGAYWVWEINNAGRLRFVKPAGSLDVIATDPIPFNQWVHVSITRASGTIDLWVNGSSAASLAGTSDNWSSGILKIGTNAFRSIVSDTYWNGYISNLRIVNGVAVYTGSFTPPTAPIASTQSSGTNISAITGTQTSLLTCQSNRFKDNSAQATPSTITPNGTPRVQSFQPFSSAASYTTAAYGGNGYFNGTTDYLGLGSQTNLQLSSSDFTIETWIYPQGTGVMHVFGNLNDGTGQGSYWFIVNAAFGGGSLLQFGTGTGINVQKGTGTLSLNNWHHIAVTRSGSNIRLYLDGAQVGTTDTSIGSGTITSNGNAFIVGRSSVVSTLYVNGYLSNLRLVVGTAIYTGSTYTVPTSPLTAVSGTQLLTNFTNAGIYDAAVQNNLTTVGDAQAAIAVSRWSPTSMKFDGTGDWLTAIDGPQLQLGTGDFTIEGWVYLSATGVAYGIISKGTASTGWSVNVTSGNKLQFSYTASNLTGATSLAATTWYYFAVVRSGSATGNLKVYLNGTADATSGGAVTDNFNQTSTLYVGADRVGGSALNGYLQDVRVTKAARTITTPTAAFPTR